MDNYNLVSNVSESKKFYFKPSYETKTFTSNIQYDDDPYMFNSIGVEKVENSLSGMIKYDYDPYLLNEIKVDYIPLYTQPKILENRYLQSKNKNNKNWNYLIQRAI